MSIRFACPSCGAAGSLDATLVGRQVRCKHCAYRFNVPSPGKPEAEVYALDGPDVEAARSAATSPAPGSTFVPRRGDEPTTAGAPRKVKRTASGSTSRPGRRPESGFARMAWLIRGMIVAAVASAGIALLAPRGTQIVGCFLLILGSAMVLVGFGVGAYGAFREDFLYGFLYLVVPLYAAYYLVTRWDDLWAWFACSTAGVALVMLGTEMLRWNVVGA
jgi:hypothetical protein